MLIFLATKKLSARFEMGSWYTNGRHRKGAMKKRRQFSVAEEVSTLPHLPELETLEGFENFRQELIDEMIRTYELHHIEGDGLLKIPVKEMHSLLIRLLQKTAKFYAKHSSAEFTQWFFQQYHQALGIPFDPNTAKRARENVLHLANKLYELYQRRVKMMENA
jgi:hypothetical protein